MPRRFLSGPENIVLLLSTPYVANWVRRTPAKHFAEVCALSPKNFTSRSGRDAAPEKREIRETPIPLVCEYPWRTASESTNGGVEGMQIGGSITTIERLRRGCRIRDPDSRWTNFARVGFNEAGKQYSENETNQLGQQAPKLI